MNKITALFFAAAGVVCAQTYDYDAANGTLTITGKGSSVADRITLEGPITPGSTVPGSTEVFGDTNTIILKDVWTSPDSTRIKYVEPVSAGNKTTLKLINTTLGASGDFDMGGAGQTLILDLQSELNLYGNRLTNTTRLENEGYIETINGTISESSYLWDNKTSDGSSGVLGGRGYYSFGNVSSIETSKDFGLIKSRGQITDLEISGNYYVNGNSAKTINNDAYIVGVNASESSEGQAMTISGKLTVEAKQGTGIGVLANQLGSDDTSLENNYSGEITVKAKDAFGVKVGGNAAKDSSKAGDIYQLSVGTLNVESTITSGEETGTATGIYAKSVKRGLTADSITVKGYTEATGIHLTEGGSNLSITDIKVSAGANGTATGILASDGTNTGDLENINIANMEVSSGADAAGIRAKSVSGTVGNITVSSTDGTANGIFAESADITLSGKISSSSENGNANGILTNNNLNLTMRDGSEISASSENGEASAIRSENGNLNLTFEGGATINGDIKAANSVSLNNGGNASVNGDIEGISLAAGAEIGTVSGKMKFNQLADLTVKTSVGSLELGKIDSLDVAKVEGSTVIDSATGKVKIADGKDITVAKSVGSLELGTVESVDVIEVDGSTAIDTATGKVKIVKAKDITVSNSVGSLELGKIDSLDAAKVNGSTVIESASGNVKLGSVESVDANVIEGNTTIDAATGAIKIVKTKDITVSTSAGSLELGMIENADIAKVKGSTYIENATGKVKIAEGKDITVAKSVGSLELGTVESVYATNVDGSTTIDTATGDVKIAKGKDITVSNSVGSLELGTVENVNVAKVNGSTVIGTATGDVKIGGAKDLTISSVRSGVSKINNVEENLTASMAGGSLNVEKVGGTAEISGDSGSAQIEKASIVNVVSDKVGRLSDNGQGIATDGDLKISVDNAESVNFAKVNGGDINGAENIKDLTIDHSDGILNIGMSKYASRNITVKKATAQVNVGEANNIDITLANDADLVASADSKIYGRAIVNGGCNATFQDVNNLVVGQNNGAGGVSGLDGNLTVNGTVNNAVVSNVSGDVRINAVANSAHISNASSATIENAGGNVSLEDVNSATVNNSTADITATNVSGGLTVGNVANVNLENTGSLNVLDGKTVSGDITSTTDLTLTNGGSATIAGSISAAGRKLTIDSVFDVNSSASTVISAATLSGSGLRQTINNHYNRMFGFDATDDTSGSLTGETSLKGTHNVSTGAIVGAIEGDLAAVENAYTKVKYVNVGNNVGYEIQENSYLTDAVAKTAAEKAYASIYDNLEYVEGDDAANAASVAKKRKFAAMASSGMLGSLLPQSVVHSVRMNMDLTDAIHLDSLNRMSASADFLAMQKARGISARGTSTVTVRNINRFAFYGGDANIDAASDYITGALANVEYTVNDDMFAGLGVGGFQAKSTGRGNCGKAQTQSVAVNAYANWRFFDNFDWYAGATYAFGMNNAERMNIIDKSRAEWDSNLVGVFTGVRYAWKPVEDVDFYIKPTLGVNANFLMNPSFSENSGSERLDTDSDNYTSLKSLAGIEATYAFSNGLYVSARMFYTHEFCDESYDISSTISGTSTALFTKGWKMDADAGVFGVGIGYDINQQWRIYADYSAEVSSEVYHNINAGIQLKF